LFCFVFVFVFAFWGGGLTPSSHLKLRQSTKSHSQLCSVCFCLLAILTTLLVFFRPTCYLWSCSIDASAIQRNLQRVWSAVFCTTKSGLFVWITWPCWRPVPLCWDWTEEILNKTKEIRYHIKLKHNVPLVYFCRGVARIFQRGVTVSK